MNLDGEEAGKWKEETRRALAEIALGVRERGDLVYWDTYREVGYEIYERGSAVSCVDKFIV